MGRGSRNPLNAGDRIGHLEIISPDTGKRQGGHIMARVRSLTCAASCRYCKGEEFNVRVDNLRPTGKFKRVRIVSCGKVKAAYRREYMNEQNARAEALNLPGVDAMTGEPITGTIVQPRRKVS